MLAGIGILGILCLWGCTEKRNVVENTFEGLKDNMVFDVLWKDKEETWFAGNASYVTMDGLKSPILLTAYHLFSDEETFGEADSGYKANVIKSKIGGTLYDIKDCNKQSFTSGNIDFNEAYKKAAPIAEIDQPLLIEDAISLHNDVAAFTLKDSSYVTPLPVSETDCQFGDVVYILGTHLEKKIKKRIVLMRLV